MFQYVVIMNENQIKLNKHNKHNKRNRKQKMTSQVFIIFFN